MTTGFAIWLTGLPSSGKTTIGLELARRLKQRGRAVEVLDGDEIRRNLSADLGFSARDRREHARRVVYVAKLLTRNGIVAVVPLISPYQESRAFARRELGRLVEVYVKCPVEECIRRDVKGLYARALRGEISDFTGVSDGYEEPQSPEVVVETNLLSVGACCQRITAVAARLGYLVEGPPDGGDPSGKRKEPSSHGTPG